MKLKYITAVLLSAAAVFSIGGCAADKTSSMSPGKSVSADTDSYSRSEDISSCTKEIFAMDTYMTVTAYGENAEKAVSEALGEIQRLDALLAAQTEGSEIAELNKNGSGLLSEDSQSLYEKAKYIYETTGGAYDITVYPLMKLWGFASGEPSLPSDDDIHSILESIGFDKLKYEGGTLTLGKGQGIDLGGIAKGYTSDRIMKIFEENGIVSGVVSLGGNVQCFGTKTDGSLWRCGITDPEAPDAPYSLIGKVEVRDKAVITSGGYERYFTDPKSGKTYHHIMDPKTGYSAENGLISVSIVSPDGALADGLSTACFVMGEEKAQQYWRNHRDEFDMILVTSDGRLIITEGIAGSFSSEREYTVCKQR